MDNSFESASEDSTSLIIVKRFETMLKQESSLFFDVEEFEELLNYYSSQNNYTKAMEVANHALAQHPKSACLLLGCAQIHVSIHKPQEALRYLQLAECYEPFNGDLAFTKASIFSQLRKSDKAIEFYKKALEYSESAEKEDILLQLAFELENTNNYGEALSYLKQILELNPENETALYEVGFCYDFSDRIEDGMYFFSKFVDKHPYSYIAWYNLGITYEKLNLYEKAIDCYDFAIAINSEFPSAFFNKAHTLGQMGKYQDAIKCYEETLEFEENDALSYYYIGESHEKLEDYQKALLYYKKAIDLDELLADAWLGMASSYFELGQDLDSLAHVKKALTIDELNVDAYYLLGDVQSALGFHEEALSAYEKVFEIDEANESILIDLAICCNELDRLEQAMDYYCIGVKNQPDNAKLLYNFVAFLLKKGDIINALFYLDTALKKHYEQSSELFEVYEEAKFHPQVIELMEHYKK